MKRTRSDFVPIDNGLKKDILGKTLYHCPHPTCKFIACTKHNIDKHFIAKHQKPDEMKIDLK